MAYRVSWKHPILMLEQGMGWPLALHSPPLPPVQVTAGSPTPSPSRQAVLLILARGRRNRVGVGAHRITMALDQLSHREQSLLRWPPQGLEPGPTPPFSSHFPQTLSDQITFTQGGWSPFYSALSEQAPTQIKRQFSGLASVRAGGLFDAFLGN